MTREIVFDTETTGFSPEEGHRIIEIGAVEISNRIPTGRTFHTLINPERAIDEGASRVSQIYDKDVVGKPVMAEVVDDWLAFVGDAPLVAHNASFDMNFLRAEYAHCGKPPPSHAVVDTLVLAKQKFPGSRHNLDSLCRRFGIDLSERETQGHGALLDSYLLVDVYVALLGGLQEGLTLEAGNTQEVAQQTVAPVSIPTTVFLPTEAELAAHAAFCEKHGFGAPQKNT